MARCPLFGCYRRESRPVADIVERPSLTRNRHGLLKISPYDSQRQESFYKLLFQFRESRIDPRKYRGLSELREDTLCLSQMLKREGTLFLDLVK
jgi:hypothetical protein